MPDPLAELARLEGVPSAVAAALDSVDAVLRDRGLRVLSPDAVAESLLLGARANAGLTGDGDRWLAGAVRLSAELTVLAGTLRVAPAQALARAHVLVARGQVAADELGRVRSDPATSDRLAGLTALLTGPSAASAVVLGAVLHAELVAVAPFGSADDVVARAVEHMVLVSGGVTRGRRSRSRPDTPSRRRPTGPRWPATSRGRRSGCGTGCCTAPRRSATGPSCSRCDGDCTHSASAAK